MFAQNPALLTEVLGVQVEGDDEGAHLPPGAQVISVTEEERAAIERVSIIDLSSLNNLTISLVGGTRLSKALGVGGLLCV